MLQLQNLTIENLADTLTLQAEPWQTQNLATIAEEIAKAYVLPEQRIPLVITSDEKVIGFMVFDPLEFQDTIDISYFLIDRQNQNKGYGTKALKQFITFAEIFPDKNKIRCVVNTGDLIARKTLESSGFMRGRTNLDKRENEMIFVIR